MRGGHGAKDGWPMMEVRPFERMRVGQKQRMEHEVGVMLGQVDDDALSGLDVAEEEVSTGAWVAQTSTVPAVDNSSERLLSLEAEVVLLRSQLSRAKQINDQIWSGVVDHAFEKKRATEDVKE
jgi:pre-rRNA-processing protein IPI3